MAKNTVKQTRLRESTRTLVSNTRYDHSAGLTQAKKQTNANYESRKHCPELITAIGL